MTVRSVTRRELAEDEHMLRSDVATMRRDGKKLDGELFLTNRRVLFVGMDQNRIEWSLSALVSAKMNNALIFCDDGIKLLFSDGSYEVFILHNREEWVVDILAAKIAPVSARRTEEGKGPLLDYDRGALRENLMKVCNQNELRTLTFELGVDLENLSGDNKEEKVRELIRYCERAGKLRALLIKCRNLNPNISWPEV
jgi:hypothetical protein